MRQVVLTHLPGLNYFIGTFDITNYKIWWKSEPLPGEVANIEHALWVGGPMHICLAKMVDGTWSIFLSFDYGVRWQLVKNSVVEIMDIELVTFTWLLYSDANGDWWESTNSGLTWAKVCTSGPVGKAFFVLHIGGATRIFSHDGRYIKVSDNVARSWATACDLQSVWISGDDNSSQCRYTGLVVPAICGANNKIYASNGPYIVRSFDAGATFVSFNSWDNYWWAGGTAIIYDLESSTNHICFPPRSIVDGNRNGFLVTDMVVSSVDGPLGADVAAVFLTKDLDGRVISTGSHNVVVGNITNTYTGSTSHFPAKIVVTLPHYQSIGNNDFLSLQSVATVSSPGLAGQIVFVDNRRISITVYSQVDLQAILKSIVITYDIRESGMNRIFKTYSGQLISPNNNAPIGAVYANFWVKFIYQQSGSLGALELSSYQLLTPGGNTWDRLLFSAMASVDSNGLPVVSMQYSTNGGLTFKKININQIEVYSGNVDEEPDTEGGAFTLVDYANMGWLGGQCNNTGYWDYVTGERLQMFSYDMDLVISGNGSKGYSLSAIIDNLIVLSRDVYYLLSIEMQKRFSTNYGLNAAISHRFDVPYSLAAYVQKEMRHDYYIYADIQGERSKFYTLDALITDSQEDEMLVALERRIPQAWNLIFPQIAKSVYDSRRTPETD